MELPQKLIKINDGLCREGISKELLNWSRMNIPNMPLIANLYINSSCNQRCFFCFLGEKPVRQETGEAPNKSVIEIVKTLLRSGMKIIDVGGVEPLNSKNTLFEIIRTASPYANVGFITNGSAEGGLTSEDACELKKAGVGSITVSILSSDPSTHDRLVETPGAHQTAMRTLKNLLSAGVDVGVQTICTKLNLDEILPLSAKLYNWGAISHHIFMMMPGEWTRFCKGGFWEIALKPAGYIKFVRKLNEYRRQLNGRFHLYYDIFPSHVPSLQKLLQHKWHRHP